MPHPCQQNFSRRNKRLGIYVVPKVKYSHITRLKCKLVNVQVQRSPFERRVLYYICGHNLITK